MSCFFHVAISVPALRGKDYGKTKMKYPDYTETESGLQYKVNIYILLWSDLHYVALSRHDHTCSLFLFIIIMVNCRT